MVYLTVFLNNNIMALIKFGMMMTDARGKLGGQVFTKTRSGATIRTKVTPSNPQTGAQQTARAILGNLSTAWRSLSEVDRRGWNAAVESFKKTNIFGDIYNPSGKNLFVGLNANKLSIGEERNDSPPTPVEVPAVILEIAQVELASLEINLTIVGDPPGGSTIIVYQATKPSSAGRFNFSGQYATFTSKVGTALETPALLYSSYVAKFGVPAVGQKIAFQVFCLDKQSGQKSVVSTITAVVEV